MQKANPVGETFKRAFVAGSGCNYLLMTGDNLDRLDFTEVNIDEYKLVDVSIGGMFALGITERGEASVWGVMNTTDYPVPFNIGVNKVRQISCGWDNALLLLNGGQLLGLGRNKQRQLDDTNTGYYQRPIVLEGIPNIGIILGGFRQSYISDGTEVLGRGSNKNKELGAVQQQAGWTAIGRLQGVVKLRCGKRFLLALTKNGDLFGCGDNQYGVMSGLPETIGEFTLAYHKVIDFSAGWNHVVLVTEDGLKSYGRNNFGQLGRLSQQESATVSISNSQQLSSTTKLASGTEFTVAEINGEVYGWGWNQHNNISPLKSQTILQPVLVPVPFHVRQIGIYGASTVLLS